MQTDQTHQADQSHQSSQHRGLVCRFRSVPKPLSFGLLVLPVAVGAFGLASVTSAAGATGERIHSVAVVGQPISSSAHPKPVTTDPARLRAYFRAGYDYDDAVLLARLWAHGTTPYDAKLRAGDKLLHHAAVPTRPGQTAWDASKDVARQAYYENGCTPTDAVRLARVWRDVRGLSDVKALAGRKILAGIGLPQAHRPSPHRALDAYFAAGYDYDDAVLLARFWGQGTTPSQAKVHGGEKLLAHAALPTWPGGSAWEVSDDDARVAYFDNGYGYDDALRLARVWTGIKEIADVKATAGRKLLAGLPLPLSAA